MHYAIRVAKWQRPKQHRIQHTEYGYVRTQSQGKRQNCHERKAWAQTEQTEGIAKLLPE